jgi:hypothetical protein
MLAAMRRASSRVKGLAAARCRCLTLAVSQFAAVISRTQLEREKNTSIRRLQQLWLRQLSGQLDGVTHRLLSFCCKDRATPGFGKSRAKTNGGPVSGGARRLPAIVLPPQRLRQLGDVGGDAPRLIAGEQVCRRAPPRSSK